MIIQWPWSKNKLAEIYFDVLDLGPMIKEQWHGDLNYYRTDKPDWGPKGIMYWGALSRGLFKSSDQNKIEVTYDPKQIRPEEIRNFLESLAITLKN